jgi:hypothetical protein
MVILIWQDQENVVVKCAGIDRGKLQEFLVP